MSGPRMRRPRSQARYGPERGTVYLLHFDRPFKHARHYTGWTKDLAARLDDHRRGDGARLMQMVRAAGIGFTVARIWPGSTRDYEDSLKHQGGASKYCPECGANPGRPRLTTGGPRQRAAADRQEPEPAERYQFEDWPALTAEATSEEAAALARWLHAGAQAERHAASEAGFPSAEWEARYDTYLETHQAWQAAIWQTAEREGRDPEHTLQLTAYQAAIEAAANPPEDPRRTAAMPVYAFNPGDEARHGAPQRTPPANPEPPRADRGHPAPTVAEAAGEVDAPDPETSDEPGDDAHHWTAEPLLGPDRRPATTPQAAFDRAVSAAEAASARARREEGAERMAERSRDQQPSESAQRAVEEAQQYVRQALHERQAATEDAYARAADLFRQAEAEPAAEYAFATDREAELSARALRSDRHE